MTVRRRFALCLRTPRNLVGNRDWYRGWWTGRPYTTTEEGGQGSCFDQGQDERPPFNTPPDVQSPGPGTDVERPVVPTAGRRTHRRPRTMCTGPPQRQPLLLTRHGRPNSRQCYLLFVLGGTQTSCRLPDRNVCPTRSLHPSEEYEAHSLKVRQQKRTCTASPCRDLPLSFTRSD